jgi:hypothetical protein
MKCTVNTAIGIIAALIFSVLAVGDAAAVQLTLSLVHAESDLELSGSFSNIPFLTQDGLAGTTDLNPTFSSMRTGYQGTITVDVDNLVAPTTIKLISSAADADLSGKWLPALQPVQDLNGDGECCELGAPPDGDSSPAGANPGVPGDADYGVRVFLAAFNANIAFGAQRDLVFNITTPGFEAVNGSGEFSSLTQNFEFATGWFDYWVANGVPGGNIRGRAELAGGDEDNLSAALSKFTVTALPGNQKEYKLFIPVNVDFPSDDAPTNYKGQLVATLVTPEPTGFVLFGTAVFAFVLRRRK